MQPLVHENVARIYAVFLESFLWIVSEYAEYGAVRSIVQACFGGSRGLGEEEAVAVLSQAAQGLAFMHGCSYLHRDVCGNNVILCGDGTVKLTGTYAVAVAETSRDLVGTLTHAAPEVVWGTDYAPACDIWSLGITALELLHGTAPHEAQNPPLRIVQAIVHGDTPEIAPSVSVSPAVAAVVKSCLNRDPTLRPTAAHVASLLQRGGDARSRLVAFVREHDVPSAAERFAEAHPELCNTFPPNYVPATPVSSAQISAAISAVSKQKKSKPEPQLTAINSNPDVSPTVERLAAMPVNFPASAQEAKQKKVSAIGAPVATLPNGVEHTSPQLERAGSSEVKKIGKFTVTTTTPAPKMSRQMSGSFSAVAGGVSPMTTHVQQGKFTITTTQHGPLSAAPSPAGAVAAGTLEESPRMSVAASASVRPVLEMLLSEQREQSRMLTELLVLATKQGEELRALREDNAKLRARLDRKE